MASAALWTLAGCCCNTIGVELHSKQVAGHGHCSYSLLTFTTFLFMAMELLLRHPNYLWRRHIPIRSYLTIVLIFFLVNVANNRVLAFNLPFPLIIIFRSGTLVANVLFTWLLQNRNFSWNRIASVLMVTAGIVLFTLASNDQRQNGELHNKDVPQLFTTHTTSILLGVLILSITLFASAYLGILQEHIYMIYGKHPDEMMFYVHFLSLPLFIFVGAEIRDDFVKYAQSPVVDMYIAQLPTNFLSLAALVILQVICIHSVYRLAAETSSLQVTMTLTLRKFLNILFSVVIFNNQFGPGHLIATGMVLIGSFTFYEAHSRCWQWLINQRPTRILESPDTVDKKKIL